MPVLRCIRVESPLQFRRYLFLFILLQAIEAIVMGMEIPNRSACPNAFEQMRWAREVIVTEGRAVLSLADRIDSEFCRATRLLLECKGRVIVSGIGKAGLIGQKIVATMASTGTLSQFLHPAEAVHGDLGCVDSNDVILILSQSGETDEITRLLPNFADMNVPVIAITGNLDNTLGRCADVTLNIGKVQEAGDLALAPTTSTTMMLALGDALALVVSQMRQFCEEDFARFHPGGNLGRQLASVDDVMRPLDHCRVANEKNTVRQVLVAAGRPGRRSGAILLINDHGLLTGMYTDSDLVRLLESQRDQDLDRPIDQVMTRQPVSVKTGKRVHEAIAILAERKISELPVVDSSQKPVGLIDITDVVGLSSFDTISQQVENKGGDGCQVPGQIPEVGSEGNNQSAVGGLRIARF